MRTLFLGSMCLMGLYLSSCGSLNTSETASLDTAASFGSEAEIDSEKQAMASSVEVVSEAAVADEDQDEAGSEKRLMKGNRGQGKWRRFGLGSLGCPKHDEHMTAQIACDDASHELKATIDFGAGCRVGNHFNVTGGLHFLWTKMGSPACVFGETERPDFWTAVQGDGSLLFVSTDELPNDGTCGSPKTAITRHFGVAGVRLEVIGCQELAYSDYTADEGAQSVTEILTIPSISRIRYKPHGDKLFDHTVTSPKPLKILVVKDEAKVFPTRLIQEGQIDVSHNVADYTVHTVYHDVQFDRNLCLCYPISGTIEVTATDNISGATRGSGEITFTQTVTGECGSHEATFSGEAIQLPLSLCR
ncbi:MAG: hypothetical protein HY540_08355 [Deltaproteobacteria bacterium]|nr:hypothetical protein [Deltaproteobacteria bacterium]